MARRSNSFLAPVVAIIVSGGAGIFLFSLVNSKDTKAVIQTETIIKEAPTVQILVATNDIITGKRILSDDLSWRAWPKSLLNHEYITFDENSDRIQSLIGGIAKMSIISGEPIIEGKIVQPGDRGAMAVLLRKGMRAVSVPITAITSAGGFILPGDFVDVILTADIVRESLFQAESNNTSGNSQLQKPLLKDYLALRMLAEIGRRKHEKSEENAIKDKTITEPKLENGINDNVISLNPEVNKKILSQQKSENNLVKEIAKEDELLVANSQRITELMLENVRVLAIDQSVNQTSTTQEDSEKPQGASAIVGTTATFEVTPEQAKLLAWAATTGTLTLSLRSFNDTSFDEDGLAANERLPVTKTSFAWPINILSGINNYNDDIKGLQLIRNGRISVLNSPASHNHRESVQNSGDTDVQR
jgi:Flp pilus assembly protein CpaB